MFDILKKKITGFIDNLTKKEEKKVEEKKPEPKKDDVLVTETVKTIKKEESISIPKIVREKTERKPEPKHEPKPEPRLEVKIPAKPQPQATEVLKPEKKQEPKHAQKTEVKLHPKPVPEEPKEQKPKYEAKQLPKPEPKSEEKPSTAETKKLVLTEEKKPESDLNLEAKPQSGAKLGIFKQITSIFTGEVEISSDDVRDLLDNLELELLEGDVALEVAEEIKNDLQKKMVGIKVRKGDLNTFIKNSIRDTLVSVIENEKVFDIVSSVTKIEKPVKIMFLGINGSGKTTTIAKVAKMLMDNNYKVVLAASDTFRAAAIEQLQVHADRLGVKLIKRDYGSDPTAVAYDAMNHAAANKLDVVLIDTAGRQETNLNLVNELKKMNRVIVPQLKIYIGESIAGNSIIQQVSEFNKEIGIDGVILTKLDCDAKGGAVLSISKTTGIPIIYLGTGQAYSDIEKFDAKKIVDRIIG